MSIFEKEATAVQGQDPGDTSTSGLGGLISRSELIKKIAERNINPNNTSLQDFESLVVTDPDILDPSIDISGLRTQPDVSPFLLGNIPDYAGIQYEAFNPRRLSDLMRLYSSGLPVIDTAQIPGAVDTLVDVGGGDGGMDQVTGGSVLDTPTAQIPGAVDTLINVGGGADMGTVPATTPVDNRIQIENISADPYSIGRDIDDPGASIENLAALQTPSSTTRDIKPIQDLPMAQEPLDIPTQDVGLAYTGEFDPDDEGTVFDTSELTGATPQQRNTIQNILTAAGDNVQGALTELGKIPGAIVDFANQTVDLFGKKLNVGKTLASLAINKVVGAPVSLLFDLLPEGGIAPSTNTARSTGLLQGDNTVTKDKYGISTQTSFDPVQSTINYNNYNVKQVEKLENRLDELNPDVNPDSKYKTQEDYLKNTKRMRKELEDRKEYLNTINKDPLYGGDIDERDQMLEDISLQNRAKAEADAIRLRNLTGDADFGATPTTTTTGVNPFAGIDTGVGEFDTGTNIVDEVALTGAPTALELAAGQPIFDERLGFVDAAGNPIQTTGDVQLAGSVEENVLKGYQRELDSLKGQKEQVGELGLPTDQIDDAIKDLEETIEKLEEEIKPVTIEQTGLGGTDDFDTTPITTTTPTTTGGPPSVISRPTSTFDAEAEDEIFEAPTPTPSPRVPDFISGGGGDRDPDPAPSAPAKTSQGVTTSQFQAFRDTGGGADRDPAPTRSSPVSTRGQAGPPSQRGGGGGSSGGGSRKIVCSMMNESYGFGSFRNKIWLRHSKNLAPEYEKGYHKIFLPLVNYAKKDGITNKIVKKTIEHLMVHRTIDIRQEARGKMHLLGRIYRKIFEPICYFVGKHG